MACRGARFATGPVPTGPYPGGCGELETADPGDPAGRDPFARVAGTVAEVLRGLHGRGCGRIHDRGESLFRGVAQRACADSACLARDLSRPLASPIRSQAIHDDLVDDCVGTERGEIHRGPRDVVRADLLAAKDLFWEPFHGVAGGTARGVGRD